MCSHSVVFFVPLGRGEGSFYYTTEMSRVHLLLIVLKYKQERLGNKTYLFVFISTSRRDNN